MTYLTPDQKSLENLKADYKKKHKSNLADDIDSKCKGDARPILLEMVGKGICRFYVQFSFYLLNVWSIFLID